METLISRSRAADRAGADSPAVRDGWSVLSGDGADAPRVGWDRRPPRLGHGVSAHRARLALPRVSLLITPGVALCLDVVSGRGAGAHPRDEPSHGVPA
jgi:hypothetical protein